MNLRKTICLSLVCVCANALSFEDAIQNVDLNGFLRYRYDTTRVKDLALNIPTHKIRSELAFTSNIADNYKVKALFRYDTKSASYGDDAYINTSDTFKIRDINLTYTNFDTNFSFGRLKVPSLFNDGVLTTGLLIQNNSLENISFNAYMIDNLDLSDSDLINDKALTQIAYKISTKETNIKPYPVSLNERIFTNNIYGANANYSDNNFNISVGFDYINTFGSFYGADIKAYFGNKKDWHYGINAQLVSNSIAKGIKNHLDATNGVFYGLEANLGFNTFDFDLGYVNYGKKDKITFATWHDKGQLLRSGKIIMDAYHGGLGKRQYLYTNLAYKYDDVKFILSVINGDVKTNLEKYKQFEVMPKVVYSYSKKLKFSIFYDYANTKFSDKNVKEYKTRFEAKYSF